MCRLYDIGEVEGRPFISMEYVQGEDLASLLRRVGRLPEERGLELARQLCAALAAAHEENVLHRDLKPANILIDENGQVRITDLGLASVVGDIDDAGSGTPAYMAPEQLKSQEVSVQSELFSLGLILYEVFTGRKAFSAKNLSEIGAAHRNWSVPTPSSAVRELSAETEAAILKCLAASRDERPTSALALSAVLPGGDALAEALAAGKTPSPDLVAAAGEKSAMPAPKALAGFAIAIAGILSVYALRAPTVLINQIPLDKPPPVLIDRVATMLEELSFEPAPYSVYGMYVDSDYLNHVEARENGPSRWDVLATGRPAAMRFWYRQSPEPLVPANLSRSRPTRTDPPLDTTGMVRVELDWEGRLLELQLAPESAVSEHESVVDWTQLIALSGFGIADVELTGVARIPPVFADERRAWVIDGMRLEAATLSGRPVWLRVFGP